MNKDSFSREQKPYKHTADISERGIHDEPRRREYTASSLEHLYTCRRVGSAGIHNDPASIDPLLSLSIACIYRFFLFLYSSFPQPKIKGTKVNAPVPTNFYDIILARFS